eukprot:gnl/MRDRNA2_/MRDRNA2_208380_c0_seq1.p1 gnl/MRDRNA2_/MRDRNA2_208380_c0~~gnl/MRDRNA2_/MRDRNA2_208380_c0_seq1.p1  ORF type:complete len:126 (+),score=7.40 gnl/MRDRNA2_/MRDRNA2_208380_c0_seq1:254-631(+)
MRRKTIPIAIPNIVKYISDMLYILIDITVISAQINKEACKHSQIDIARSANIKQGGMHLAVFSQPGEITAFNSLMQALNSLNSSAIALLNAGVNCEEQQPFFCEKCSSSYLKRRIFKRPISVPLD